MSTFAEIFTFFKIFDMFFDSENFYSVSTESFDFEISEDKIQESRLNQPKSI